MRWSDSRKMLHIFEFYALRERGRRRFRTKLQSSYLFPKCSNGVTRCWPAPARHSNAGPKKTAFNQTIFEWKPLIRRIADIRDAIASNRTRIKELEHRRQLLKKEGQSSEPTEVEYDEDMLNAELSELHDRFESDKKQLERLEKDVGGLQDGASELLEVSTNEQREWAEAFLGDSEIAKKAERLLKLQSEWVGRFNVLHGFREPLLRRAEIVASTCVGLTAASDVGNLEFDLCIIDEASKATAMEACVPFSRSKKWVLVGDSKQLPPFREEILASAELRSRYKLESEEAVESLFERFRRKLPAANQAMLTKQYRMVEPIGRMVSECFYDGQLESMRKNVDARSLVFLVELQTGLRLQTFQIELKNRPV